jgi:hypothetical protein
VFENKVLRRIFGPKRDEVAEAKRPLGSPRNRSVNNIKIDLEREWSDPTCRNLP